MAYFDLKDKLTNEIMIAESNFKRAKIIFGFAIIVFPIFTYFMMGDLTLVFFALVAMAALGGFIILQAWWDLRSAHNNLRRKCDIDRQYR